MEESEFWYIVFIATNVVMALIALFLSVVSELCLAGSSTCALPIYPRPTNLSNIKRRKNDVKTTRKTPPPPPEGVQPVLAGGSAGMAVLLTVSIFLTVFLGTRWKGGGACVCISIYLPIYLGN